MKYSKPEHIWLKGHPELNETWVQQRIAEDPALLGLGDLILKDKERSHPSAGRLDLLFQDSEVNSRYEVEVQLGKTDESHLVRTLEYWDIEKKRYPQYEHTAVIVAEEITGRFLNVISMFNGFIPVVAIQMQAFKSGDQVMLIFTKVLDVQRLGLVDEDEEQVEVTDRSYWEEKRGNKKTVEMADEVLTIIRSIVPDLSFKYNKFYIGMAETNGKVNNSVMLKPQKNSLRVELRLEKSDVIQKKLDDAGLELISYDTNWGLYQIRLAKDDIVKHQPVLKELIEMAYKSK